MLDEKGTLFIMDAFLAIVLVLCVFLVLNTAITMETPQYSYESHDIKSAQDIMELLSGKIDFTDQTFLSKISYKLKNERNSVQSIREVSQISKEKLDSYNLKHYSFIETNILNGEVLAHSGDYKKASNLSVATRDYGDYSYSLMIW